jgi:DNA polymerase sigma
MRLQNLRKKMNSPQKCHQYSFNMKNVFLLNNTKNMEHEENLFEKIDEEIFKKEITLKMTNMIKMPFIKSLKNKSNNSMLIFEKEFDFESNTSAEIELGNQLQTSDNIKKENSSETILKLKESEKVNKKTFSPRQNEKRDILKIQRDSLRSKCKSVQNNCVEIKESFLESNSLEKEIFSDLQNKILKNQENSIITIDNNLNQLNCETTLFSPTKEEITFISNNKKEEVFDVEENNKKIGKNNLEEKQKSENKRGLKKKPKLRKLVKNNNFNPKKNQFKSNKNKHTYEKEQKTEFKNNFEVKIEKIIEVVKTEKINYFKKEEKKVDENFEIEEKQEINKLKKKIIIRKKWEDLEKPKVEPVQKKSEESISLPQSNSHQKQQKKLIKKEKIREIKKINKWTLEETDLFLKKNNAKQKLRKGQVFDVKNSWNKKTPTKKEEAPVIVASILTLEEKENLIKEKMNSSINEKMNKKLEELIDTLGQHSNELKVPREIITNRIDMIVKKTFQNEKIHVKKYGSFATGLLTPFSDLDLSIQGCYYCDINEVKRILECLTDNLKLFKFIKKAQAILTAAVPVIKIIADSGENFEEDNEKTEDSIMVRLDITVDLMEKINITSSSIRTTDFVKWCVEHYPSFFSNVLLIKYALSTKGLNNCYKGGLNSYGLCLLYLAFLGFSGLEKEKNCFIVLQKFLEYYTNEFQNEKTAINIGHGLCNLKNPYFEKNYLGTCELIITDPTSLLYSNVTPSCSKFETIKEYFKEFHQKISNYLNHITSFFEKFDENQHKDFNKFLIRFENPFVDQKLQSCEENPFYDFFSIDRPLQPN